MNMNNRALKRTNVAMDNDQGEFRFYPKIDYSADPPVAIGSMSVVCPHCVEH